MIAYHLDQGVLLHQSIGRRNAANKSFTSQYRMVWHPPAHPKPLHLRPMERATQANGLAIQGPVTGHQHIQFIVFFTIIRGPGILAARVVVGFMRLQRNDNMIISISSMHEDQGFHACLTSLEGVSQAYQLVNQRSQTVCSAVTIISWKSSF